jgi:hypothetical protein
VGNWLDIGGEVDPGRVEVFDSSAISLFKDILKGAGRNPLGGKKKRRSQGFFQNESGRRGSQLHLCPFGSENGIKIQIWVALILNLLFTVLHKRVKETEDFFHHGDGGSKNFMLLCQS